MEPTSRLDTQPADLIADGPRGLGGWLILPIIHLTATMLLTGYILYDWILNWAVVVAFVTGQVDPTYQWMVWPTLISLVLGVVIVAFALHLLVILFQKKRELPQRMVWFYVVLLGATLIDSGLVLQNPQRWTEAEVVEARRSLGQAVIMAVIWIPYFLRSKRVQATFVN